MVLLAYLATPAPLVAKVALAGLLTTIACRRQLATHPHPLRDIAAAAVVIPNPVQRQKRREMLIQQAVRTNLVIF